MSRTRNLIRDADVLRKLLVRERSLHVVDLLLHHGLSHLALHSARAVTSRAECWTVSIRWRANWL